MFVNDTKNIEIDTGIAMAEFETLRDEIMKDVVIPDRLRGLTVRELHEIDRELWKNEFYKPRRKRRTSTHP